MACCGEVERFGELGRWGGVEEGRWGGQSSQNLGEGSTAGTQAVLIQEMYECRIFETSNRSIR